MTRLVVPGVDPADQRTSWEVLRINLARTLVSPAYRNRGRRKAERRDRAKVRGVVITEAGRAYLAQMRQAALNAAGGA